MNDLEPRKQGMTGGQKALIGCGVIALIIVILIGVGIYWAFGVGMDMAADMTYSATSTLMDDARVEVASKQAVLTEFARVRDGVKSGQIGVAQFGLLLQEVIRGPEMATVLLSGFPERYVQPSGLSDEEKAAAPLIVQRFIRGVIEGSIADTEVLDVWYDISVPITYGNEGILERQLAPTIDDDDVREILADLKSHADGASVPSDPYQPDLAAEVRKGIDRIVGP